MISLPYLLKLSIDFMVIFQSFFAVWDINLIPCELHFNKFLAMSKLGTIDSIIASKEVIINPQRRKVMAVKLTEKSFFNENYYQHFMIAQP